MSTTSCPSLLRTGTVVNYTERGLVVEISAQENCEQCAQGRGCGVGLLARKRRQRLAVALPSAVFSAGPQAVEQRYPLGHSVTISLPRASVTLLAFCVYALPLFIALLLAGVAPLVSAAVWFAPLMFFSALLIGAIGVKYLLRGRSERFRPRLVC
ncbi:MAG: Positive regulator of sigma(E), RseC/MucC [Halomonas sp. 54_146]|nr:MULTISPECIES: SoxR reducing system RseC family protein [unclassified Halomonas]KUJ88120.1 MAG: Positive regulator of sigma(E), RseC/MucC [Halomonas sp. 54_146]HAA46290.1 Fis family transcriptional regulator [Halomonas sp.]